MTDNQITVAMEKFGKSIPSSRTMEFKVNMRNADDGCMDLLMSVPMKSKWAAFVLALFLGGFGAGRFYLGDTAVAILRLVASAVMIGLSFVPILGIIASVASSIWLFAELFLCYHRAKEINFEKLNNFLLQNVKKVSVQNESVEE